MESEWSPEWNSARHSALRPGIRAYGPAFGRKARHSAIRPFSAETISHSAILPFRPFPHSAIQLSEVFPILVFSIFNFSIRNPWYFMQFIKYLLRTFMRQSFGLNNISLCGERWLEQKTGLGIYIRLVDDAGLFSWRG
jgi:hypothetical protein